MAQKTEKFTVSQAAVAVAQFMRLHINEITKMPGETFTIILKKACKGVGDVPEECTVSEVKFSEGDNQWVIKWDKPEKKLIDEAKANSYISEKQREELAAREEKKAKVKVA